MFCVLLCGTLVQQKIATYICYQLLSPNRSGLKKKKSTKEYCGSPEGQGRMSLSCALQWREFFSKPYVKLSYFFFSIENIFLTRDKQGSGVSFCNIQSDPKRLKCTTTHILNKLKSIHFPPGEFLSVL